MDVARITLALAILVFVRCGFSRPATSVQTVNFTAENAYTMTCVNEKHWNPKEHLSTGCEEALVRLEDDSNIFGDTEGLFSFNSGHSVARFPGAFHSLWLPKRYADRDCVIAIMMMKLWEETKPTYKFPGISSLRPSSWPDIDRASWRDIREAAGYIRSTCPNSCGYALVGRGKGIAITIWLRGNFWDKFVQRNGLFQSNETTGIVAAGETLTW